MEEEHGKRSHENHKDRMSELPDEILIMILSHLTMKEAIRTSVLSRKWKNLWNFFTGYMDFDMVKKTHNGVKGAKIEACKFRDWVDQVLNSHQVISIQGLRVAYDMGVSFIKDIDRWIDFAIMKKVERLELDFSHHISCHKHSADMYVFPAWLLKLPLDHSNFDNLTSLRLKSVNVTEEVFAYFLSNCPLLEQLCVHDSPNIRRLSVAGPRLKLKELEIFYCQNLVNLKISAPELVALYYTGGMVYMPLEDAPRLSSISFGSDYCRRFVTRINRLSIRISQLQQLVLDLSDMVIETPWSFPKEFPEFSNLGQLEIRFRAYDNQ